MSLNPNQDPGPVQDMGNGLRVRPMTSVEKQMYDDLTWAATAPEVQQHPGKFVVIHKKRVIAVGTDRRALVEQAAAQEQCPWWECVVELVPPLDF
jgi:Family of unknown function (DUF5678)